jgi:hypothetical protein
MYDKKVPTEKPYDEFKKTEELIEYSHEQINALWYQNRHLEKIINKWKSLSFFLLFWVITGAAFNYTEDHKTSLVIGLLITVLIYLIPELIDGLKDHRIKRTKI